MSIAERGLPEQPDKQLSELEISFIDRINSADPQGNTGETFSELGDSVEDDPGLNKEERTRLKLLLLKKVNIYIIDSLDPTKDDNYHELLNAIDNNPNLQTEEQRANEEGDERLLQYIRKIRSELKLHLTERFRQVVLDKAGEGLND